MKKKIIVGIVIVAAVVVGAVVYKQKHAVAAPVAPVAEQTTPAK